MKAGLTESSLLDRVRDSGFRVLDGWFCPAELDRDVPSHPALIAASRTSSLLDTRKDCTPINRRLLRTCRVTASASQPPLRLARA